MRWVSAVLSVAGFTLLAQSRQLPDWTGIETETLRHFLAIVRFDTSDPPGREAPAAEYIAVLEYELHRFVRFNYDVVVALSGAHQ